MAESVSNQQFYYTKEFSSYGSSEDNFVTNQELTVTITLNEYRSLVGKNSSSESVISKLKSDCWKSSSEIKQLIEENNELKAKIFELQNPTPTEGLG